MKTFRLAVLLLSALTLGMAGSESNAIAATVPVVTSTIPNLHESHRKRVVVVRRRPPAIRIEFGTRRPSNRHVWVEGHWQFHRGRYVWVKGLWTVPPRRGVVYVRPMWKRHRHGYVFVSGGWRG